MTQWLHVAVGVVRNPDGQVLIAQRPKHAHLGGLWEFPGGKVEADETVIAALQRELTEEVGIVAAQFAPLIQIKHRYPEVAVWLDVWRVEQFSGEAHGREGQPVRWVLPEQLPNYAFPAGNQSIVTAVRLPRFYAIVEAHSETQMLADLSTVLANDVKLVQLRLKSPQADGFKAQTIRSAIAQCREHDAQVLFNSGWARAVDYADVGQGWHLTSADLLRLETKPKGEWIAASCHDEQQLRKAQVLGVDFAVIAPVQATMTHPNAIPLGWERLQVLIDSTHLPVFALGGLACDDLEQAIAAGAQGIAGIRAFLS